MNGSNRYHSPDLEWWNDGRLLDRESLIAHARPARRTLRAELRTGVIETEILMLGLVGPDGRIRRIDQLTRTLPADQRGCVQRHGQRAARYR